MLYRPGSVGLLPRCVDIDRHLVLMPLLCVVGESSPCDVCMPHTGIEHYRGVCVQPLMLGLLDMLVLAAVRVRRESGLPQSLTDGWRGWPLLTPARQTVSICVAGYLMMLLATVALEVFQTAEHQWTAGEECVAFPYGPQRWTD
eukprot:3365242-Amphidinium_carterae.2